MRCHLFIRGSGDTPVALLKGQFLKSHKIILDMFVSPLSFLVPWLVSLLHMSGSVGCIQLYVCCISLSKAPKVKSIKGIGEWWMHTYYPYKPSLWFVFFVVFIAPFLLTEKWYLCTRTKIMIGVSLDLLLFKSANGAKAEWNQICALLKVSPCTQWLWVSILSSGTSL